MNSTTNDYYRLTTVLMSLEDMMANSTDTMEYFAQLAGVAPHILQELFKSSVNVDLVSNVITFVKINRCHLIIPSVSVQMKLHLCLLGLANRPEKVFKLFYWYFICVYFDYFIFIHNPMSPLNVDTLCYNILHSLYSETSWTWLMTRYRTYCVIASGWRRPLNSPPWSTCGVLPRMTCLHGSVPVTWARPSNSWGTASTLARSSWTWVD